MLHALVCASIGVAAEPADAAYSLRRTFVSPTAAVGDRFGASIAHVSSGTMFVVGAPGDSTIGPDAGAAYLFKAETTDLQQSYADPVAGDRLGAAVAALGPQVCVGAPGADIGASDAGVVQVFDTESGIWLRTLGRPTAIPGDAFGTALDGAASYLLPMKLGVGGAGGGTVYLMDPATGDTITSFANPTAAPGFGSTVYVAATVYVADDLLVFVSSPNDGTGKVYEFDGYTGTLLHTFVNPDSQAGEGFGASVALAGSWLRGSYMGRELTYPITS
jgi:hypothetical protein